MRAGGAALNRSDERRLSVAENVGFFLRVILPIVLRGAIVVRRRSGWLAHLAERLDNGYLQVLRERHGNPETFRCRMVRGLSFVDTRIVLGQGEARAVLDDHVGHDVSLTIQEVFSRFAPETLITLPDERHGPVRHFHLEALRPAMPGGCRHADLVGAVEKTVSPLVHARELDPGDFTTLGRELTHDIVFGGSLLRCDYTDSVGRMILKATRLLGRRSRCFERFYADLEIDLARVPRGSGRGRVGADVSAPEHVRLAPQVTHWLFALRDALDTHVPRALALIVSHPEVYRGVREEIARTDLDDRADVRALRLIECCVLETLRLWTATPLLVRRLSAGKRVRGEPEEVLLPLSYLHRDPSCFEGDHDRFVPGRSCDGDRLSAFQFGAGARSCAGRPLALAVMTLTVARLLGGARLSLASPSILDGTRVRAHCDPSTLHFRRH